MIDINIFVAHNHFMEDKNNAKLSPQKQVWLAINYHFPPAGMVAGFRNYEIVNNLQEKVKEVHVLTSKYASHDQNNFLDTSAFCIEKIPNWDYRFFLKKFGSFEKTGGLNFQKKTNLKRKLLDSFPTNLILGEGGIFYILIGIIKACRIARRQSVTHIYSSYRPYSDHVIAWWVKLFFPDIHWVADFADIQIDPVLKNVYWINFQHWCNRKILAKANLVTTVSKGLGKALEPYHSNIHILKNGVMKLPGQKLNLPQTSNTHFTISYTGSLYGERTALPLMKALQSLIKEKAIDSTHLKLVYAGNDFDIWRGWVEAFHMIDFLENKGLVSLAEARNLQASSQINVMLSWASPDLTGWLTFKLYDYLSVGKPILSIVNGSEDPELEEIIDKYQAGQVFYNQEEHQDRLKEFILDNYQKWLTKTDQVPVQRDLKEFDWDIMVEKMLQLN